MHSEVFVKLSEARDFERSVRFLLARNLQIEWSIDFINLNSMCLKKWYTENWCSRLALNFHLKFHQIYTKRQYEFLIHLKAYPISVICVDNIRQCIFLNLSAIFIYIPAKKIVIKRCVYLTYSQYKIYILNEISLIISRPLYGCCNI